MAMDIGGSLAKIVVVERDGGGHHQPPHALPIQNPEYEPPWNDKDGEDDESREAAASVASPAGWSSCISPGRSAHRRSELDIHVPELNATLRFLMFEISHMSDCIRFVKQHLWARRRDTPPPSGPRGGEGDADPGTAVGAAARGSLGEGLVPAAAKESTAATAAPRDGIVIRCTGGGGYGFASAFNAIGVCLDRRDEIACLVNGLNFMMRFLPGEAFSVQTNLTSLAQPPGMDMGFRRTYRPQAQDPFPYLLVNVGSGVSVIKVNGPGRDFERVSGSTIGGGTLWGLCTLLTEAETFDEVLSMCAHGKLSNVDMLVGDLYSGDYVGVGLASDIIASTFGKVVTHTRPRGAARELGAAVRRAVQGTLWLWARVLVRVPVLCVPLEWAGLRAWVDCQASSRPMSRQVTGADIALSVLRMVSNNLGQIAYLFAEKYGLRDVVFTGNTLRGHEYTMATITDALTFWSQGTMHALFLTHEGFAGALGAHLCGTPFGLNMGGSIFGEPAGLAGEYEEEQTAVDDDVGQGGGQ